jgi:Tfp pilus assembly protein PilP
MPFVFDTFVPENDQKNKDKTIWKPKPRWTTLFNHAINTFGIKCDLEALGLIKINSKHGTCMQCKKESIIYHVDAGVYLCDSCKNPER